MEHVQHEGPAVLAVKKPYTSPQLLRYGALTDLTLGASKGPNESMTPNPNPSCMNPSRKTGPACTSDIHAKENIVRVGTHPLGFGLYLFDYKPALRELCGQGRQFGVMAQEVGNVVPNAVELHTDGYLRVNYAMLGIERTLH